MKGFIHRKPVNVLDSFPVPLHPARVPSNGAKAIPSKLILRDIRAILRTLTHVRTMTNRGEILDC